MYTNCDTLTNKLDELITNIKIQNPDIIVLVEVTPKNNRFIIQKSELEMQGYTLFINDFNRKGNRGVAIYVKNKIKATQYIFENGAHDAVWVDILVEQNKKMLIGGVYRSPHSSQEDNTSLWKNIIAASERNKENLLIMGDFNCKDINWREELTAETDSQSLNNTLIETIRDCYLQQIVFENTRARGSDTPSLIDLILCYNSDQTNHIEYDSPLGKSDHCVINFLYDITCENCSYTVNRRLYDKGDYVAFKTDLISIDWQEAFTNKVTVQEMWDIFVTKIQELVNKYIPMKKIHMNRENKYKEQIPVHIRTKIKKKRNLWKRYMETKLSKTYREYCKVRNKVKNMLKFFRKQKERNISKNIKNNPKAFWKYIKSKTSVKSCINSLYTDPCDKNSLTTDNCKEKAIILNKYFASVFTKEPDGEIPSISRRVAPPQTPINICQDKIQNLLSNLKVSKSPGPDGIHPKFLSELNKELSLPLAKIFSESIKLAEIPSEWKIARVSAIHKKGDKKLASNYRPISITSIICRVMETMIRDHITTYLQNHNLLSDFQFGFIKGRSTTLQLLNVLDDWTLSLENKNITDCLYLDYQKAFDSVPHKRLISKLHSYNIDLNIIGWIENYLRDRSQYVEVNGKASASLPVTSGIPQGSVLGPLLFLIYINDLPEDIDSKIYMYADDTKIYREIKSPLDHKILQSDLDKMKLWSDIWLLNFHPDKCFSLTIGSLETSEHFTYNMIKDGNKHNLTQVDDMKDIGVTIDTQLKFEKHINSKIVTANKILGIIRRSYVFLNCEIFLPLYKALVRSHFDYAMPIWSPFRIKYVESIEKVQRRATKMIPELKNLTYPERLKKLNLPTLAYRRVRGDMIEVYKIISNIYDQRASRNILTMREQKYVNLRGHQFTLEHNRIYTASRKNFFANRVVATWNSLPSSVVGVGTLNSFKNSLDRLWARQDLYYNYRAEIEKKDYV